jgi:hypothetical protein
LVEGAEVHLYTLGNEAQQSHDAGHGNSGSGGAKYQIRPLGGHAYPIV